MSDSDLAGRTLIVTGAAGGIGRACARAAAAQGASVVLGDLDPAGLEAAAQPIGAGARVHCVPVDVTDEGQCDDLVAAAEQRFGRVDGAVLAAGVARHVPLLDMTRTEWERMLAIHLTGAFLCLRAAAAAMVRAGRGGSVVYVASTAAAGLGPLHQAHYVAAKAGALGLVRAAARELGPLGVRVNAVSPGFTRTPMNDGLFTAEEVRRREADAPLGRVAEAEDVADAVTFLLGDRSGFVTGHNLQVNGGSYLP